MLRKIKVANIKLDLNNFVCPFCKMEAFVQIPLGDTLEAGLYCANIDCDSGEERLLLKSKFRGDNLQ